LPRTHRARHRLDDGVDVEVLSARDEAAYAPTSR
jgi:hypothetical protein